MVLTYAHLIILVEFYMNSIVCVHALNVNIYNTFELICQRIGVRPRDDAMLLRIMQREVSKSELLPRITSLVVLLKVFDHIFCTDQSAASK